MKEYSTHKSRFATIEAHSTQKQSRQGFTEGDRVRLLSGVYAGHTGRILAEVAGTYQIGVYDAGFGVTTQTLSNGMVRA